MDMTSDLLVSHRHLHNRGSRIVLRVLLEPALNFGNPALGFFHVDLTCSLFACDFIKKMLKEGFHCSFPLCVRSCFHKMQKNRNLFQG